MRATLVSLVLATAAHGGDFASLAMKLRQDELLRDGGPPVMSPASAPAQQRPFPVFGVRYPWHVGITATFFYVGESAKSGGGVANDRSAYDSAWRAHFGGVDNPSPSARRNFVPATFRPRLNPWYGSLPYSDIAHGHTKPSARAIPWFQERYRRDGLSIMLGTWLQVRHDGRVCYVQVADCGPYSSDSFSYVFGIAPPPPNKNHAGIDLSPAAYQFLGLDDNQLVDWRFCSPTNVPPGPWTFYGDVAILR